LEVSSGVHRGCTPRLGLALSGAGGIDHTVVPEGEDTGLAGLGTGVGGAGGEGEAGGRAGGAGGDLTVSPLTRHHIS